MLGSIALAVIKNLHTGDSIQLRSQHVFGRVNTDLIGKNTVDTAFNEPCISKSHATIRWNGAQWIIKDNNSTNGTLFNDATITHWQTLNCGDKISFNHNEWWVMEDLAPPCSMLVALSCGVPDIALNTMHELKASHGESAWIYQVKKNMWVMAYKNIERELSDGDTVSLTQHESWHFKLESPVEKTLAAIIPPSKFSSKKMKMIFKVSADEEHVFLTLKHNQIDIDLGERVTHYLLLILARKRIEDSHANFDEDTQGWVDMSDLQKMMNLDYCHLNTNFWRAKRQFEKAVKKYLEDNTSDCYLYERRVGGVRIGSSNIEIIKSGYSKVKSHKPIYEVEG